MPHFPQLLSGAMAQYPAVVRRLLRTVVNEAADGSQYKNSDEAAARAEWDLRLRGLSNAEWQAIEDLFTEVEGRLLPFTFLDPFDNLFSHSEDLAQAVWQKDAGLTVTAGQPDPWGGHRASTLANATPVARECKQTLVIAADHRYCLSVMAQAATPVALRLRVNGVSRTVNVTTAWQRFDLLAALTDAGEGVDAAVELPAGASAVVAALQLEAQLAPSSYKMTGAAAGVYANAHFASDQLVQTATDVDQHETILRITAPWER